MVYALDITKDYMNYSIVHLEILNIMVTLKVWGHYLKDKYIEVFVTILQLCRYYKQARPEIVN